MIDRKLSGAAPRTKVPKGAIDSQMHMYLPGFEMRADGVGAPADPLPDPALCAAKLTLGNCLLFMAAPMPYKAAIQGHRQRPIDLDWLRKI